MIELFDGVLGQPEEKSAGRLRKLCALIWPKGRNLRNGRRNLVQSLRIVLTTQKERYSNQVA